MNRTKSAGKFIRTTDEVQDRPPGQVAYGILDRCHRAVGVPAGASQPIPCLNVSREIWELIGRVLDVGCQQLAQ
jgi:hypothetical protein